MSAFDAVTAHRRAMSRWLKHLLDAELGDVSDHWRASPSAAGERLLPEEVSSRLAPFQRSALIAVEQAMGRYGGVLLADEVGLGKTHIAMAAILRRRRCLVCAPASVLPMWRAALSAAGGQRGVEVILRSHALLARDGAPGDWDLVVADEAHAFVNASTRRAQALAALGLRSPLLLLTATPVGLARADLCALLRLFLPHGALAGVLGDTLEGHLAVDDPDLSPLWRTVIVRRPRRLIQRAWPHGVTVLDSQGEPQRLTFPSRREVRIPWTLDALPVGALERLLQDLEALDEGLLGLSRGTLRALLLARLESSPAALERSLARLEGFLHRRLEAAKAGRELSRAAWRRCFGALTADEDRQQVMPFLFEALPDVGARHGVVPTRGAGEAVIHALGGQLVLVQRLRRHLSPWLRRDPKAQALVTWLSARGAAQRTLIFSRFADTARALFDVLTRQTPWRGVGLISGREARAGALPGRLRPAQVLTRFMDPSRRELSILVATDVLAEGLNLQGCDHVISYDLPWNPRRLVQRHGRVDRLGVGERCMTVGLMAPEAGFERWLRLVERVSRRAEHMAQVLGDAPQLASWLRGLLRGHPHPPTSVDPGLEAEFWLREAHRELHQASRAVSARWPLEVVEASSEVSGAPRAEWPPGWRVRATPRQPAGVLLIMSLGLPEALTHWCFVPEELDRPLVTARHRLVDRLLAMGRREATPSARPPSRALRRAFQDAHLRQRRLMAARLGPAVHAPGSAAARLLRRICVEVPPRLEERDALRLHARLRHALKRPLPADVALSVGEALARDAPLASFEGILSPWLEVNSAAERQEVDGFGELSLLGFIEFVGRAGSRGG